MLCIMRNISIGAWLYWPMVKDQYCQLLMAILHAIFLIGNSKVRIAYIYSNGQYTMLHSLYRLVLMSKFDNPPVVLFFKYNIIDTLLTII